MKKLKYIILLLLFPTLVFGATSVGWNTPTPTTGWVLPNAVNGSNQIIYAVNGLFSVASSTFSSNVFFPSLSQGFAGIGSNGRLYSFASSTITTLPNLSITKSQISDLGTPVTAVSVASANGFAGSSSGGATPSLTLSTTITGLLKGNGTAISAASNGTDYTLITAKTCTAGDFVSAVTAGGVFTCTTPAGTTYIATYPITLTGSAFGLAFGTTTNNLWSGLQTFTNSSTTLASFTNASSTQYFGGGLTTCSGSNFLQWSAGFFSCGTPSGSGTVTSVVAGIGFLNRGLNISSTGTLNVGIATSSNPTLGQIPYYTGIGDASNPVTLGTVATSSLAVGTSLLSSGTLGSQIGGTASSLSINTGNTNTWTVLQNFNYSSSTAYASFVTSSTTDAYFGTGQGIAYIGSNGRLRATATSTFALSQFTNDLASLTAGDTSLTFSGAYNGSTARTAVLNMGNANTWTALQTFTNSSTTNASFSIASSTTSFFGTATSKVLTVLDKFVGYISATFTPTTEGESGVDSTSNQFKFFSNGAVRVVVPDSDRAFLIATSSMGTGTTTRKVSGFYRASTFAQFGCTSAGTGTFVARLGTGSASSTSVVSSTNNTTTFTALSSNNSFTSGQAIYFEIGSVSGTVVNPTCSYNLTVNAD